MTVKLSSALMLPLSPKLIPKSANLSFLNPNRPNFGLTTPQSRSTSHPTLCRLCSSPEIMEVSIKVVLLIIFPAPRNGASDHNFDGVWGKKGLVNNFIKLEYS